MVHASSAPLLPSLGYYVHKTNGVLDFHSNSKTTDLFNSTQLSQCKA